MVENYKFGHAWVKNLTFLHADALGNVCLNMCVCVCYRAFGNVWINKCKLLHPFCNIWLNKRVLLLSAQSQSIVFWIAWHIVWLHTNCMSILLKTSR